MHRVLNGVHGMSRHDQAVVFRNSCSALLPGSSSAIQHLLDVQQGCVYLAFVSLSCHVIAIIKLTLPGTACYSHLQIYADGLLTCCA